MPRDRLNLNRWMREWRRSNRSTVNRRMRIWRKSVAGKESIRRRKEIVRRRRYADLAAAKSKPCVDCGLELPPECMHLDHVKGRSPFSRNKKWAWNSLTQARFVAELAKCEVRCPNCHTIRHYLEWLMKRKISRHKVPRTGGATDRKKVG